MKVKLKHYYDIVQQFKLVSLEKNFTDFGCYQFGEIRHPGISDLDLLFVGKAKDMTILHDFYREKIRSDSTWRYIMFHPPVFVPVEVRELARKFHTFDNIKFVFGDCDFVEPGSCGGLLDLEWASALLSTFAELIADYQNDRQKLLFHKNLCSSLQRLCNIDFYSQVEQLRSAYLAGELETLELDQALLNLCSILCEQLQPSHAESGFSTRRRALRVSRRVRFHLKTEKYDFGVYKGRVIVNEKLFNCLKGYIFKSKHIRERSKNLQKLNNHLETLDLPTFAPVPFGLRFYHQPCISKVFSLL